MTEDADVSKAAWSCMMSCSSLPIFSTAHHILLELEVSTLDKSAEVEVTLMTENLGTEQRLRL